MTERVDMPYRPGWDRVNPVNQKRHARNAASYERRFSPSLAATVRLAILNPRLTEFGSLDISEPIEGDPHADACHTEQSAAAPRPPVHFVPPNGWRLSGDDGEADGVRWSRGLGGRSTLRILKLTHVLPLEG